MLVKLSLGAEIEFMPLYNTDCRFSRLQRFNVHRDYGVAWEVGTPVVTIRLGDENSVREALRVLSDVENLVWREGGVRVHYASYDMGCNSNVLCGVLSDSRRPMSAHLHFSATDDAMMVYVHNALVVLQPLLPTLLTLPVDIGCSDNLDCEAVCNVNKHRASFRRRVRRFASVPAYTTLASLRTARSAPVSFRGYWPKHGNSYFAVEFNKYRKPAVTVEARMNENHVAVGIVIAEVIMALRERGWRPPLAPLYELYGAAYNANVAASLVFEECGENDSAANERCVLDVLLDMVSGRVSGFSEAVLREVRGKVGKAGGGEVYLKIWEAASDHGAPADEINAAKSFYGRSFIGL